MMSMPLNMVDNVKPILLCKAPPPEVIWFVGLWLLAHILFFLLSVINMFKKNHSQKMLNYSFYGGLITGIPIFLLGIPVGSILMCLFAIAPTALGFVVYRRLKRDK